jgi:SAM-dependent methyltransferase
MHRLAPGNVLQLMYLKRRLKRFRGGTFVELGAGNGYVSHALLELGLSGRALDRNPLACRENEESNRTFIDAGRYAIEQRDFLEGPLGAPADVIVSSMVLEHLPPPSVDRYFDRCRQSLAAGGVIVTLVPANPRFWGIEDEVAGHQKRYSSECFDEICARHRLTLVHHAGLTYPLSNWLLPLSNFLVRRRESRQLGRTLEQRTTDSGHRDVPFKTVFPTVFGYLINEWTMLPFFGLQSLFRGSRDAMILYTELAARSLD